MYPFIDLFMQLWVGHVHYICSWEGKSEKHPLILRKIYIRNTLSSCRHAHRLAGRRYLVSTGNAFTQLWIYVIVYLCIYESMYLWIYGFMYLCIYVFMDLCIYGSMRLRRYVFMYFCIYACTYWCIYVLMYPFIYAFMYLCIYLAVNLCNYVSM